MMIRFNLISTYLFYCLFFIVISNQAQAQKIFFERLYDPTLSQASYIVGDIKTKQAIVIDAKRDIETYLAIAKQNGLTITHLTETHIHSDFVSGSRELQKKTGAKLYLSDAGWKEDRYQFQHVGLHDGDEIVIGNTVLKVMHTPGHTSESLSFLIEDDKGIKALTGDFIYVGGVGRPDLLETETTGIADQQLMAQQLYHSIKQFSKLPAETEIWPGHGTIPSLSTLAQEKVKNKAFQFNDDEAGFVGYILETQTKPLTYYSRIKVLNKTDRTLLVETPKYAALSKQEFKEALEQGMQIIDTRSKEVVNKGFIRGAINIEGGNKFQALVGSLISYNKPIVLIVDQDKLSDVTLKLMRIGLDYVFGYVSDINLLDLPIGKSNLIGISEFKQYLSKPGSAQMLDVRSKEEFQQNHIQGEQNIPVNALEQNLAKISKEKPVIIHCQSGTRATIAYSILSKNGYTKIAIYLGGINDWVANGGVMVH